MGNGLKEHIAVLMSQAIVNVFEVIKVKIEKSTSCIVLLGLVNMSCQVSLTAHSIVKTRQEISVGLLLNTPLIQLFVGNIVEGEEINLSSVYPGNSCAQKVVPHTALNIGELAGALLVIHGLAHIKKLVDGAVLKLSGKVVSENSVGKKHGSVFAVSYVNAAAYVVKNSL